LPRREILRKIITEIITTEKITEKTHGKNIRGMITTKKNTTVDYEQTKGTRYWRIKTNKEGGQE
jgi:hypothetical protein